MRIGVVVLGLKTKQEENEASLVRRVGKLVERYPEATFVCVEKRSDRMAAELLNFWDVTPEVLPVDESWRRVETAVRAGEFNGRMYEAGDKVTIYDLRKQMRDSAMRQCDKVLVLIPRGSSSDWRTFVEKDAAMRERFPSMGPPTVFLSEYGEAPPPKPKVRRAKKKAQTFA